MFGFQGFKRLAQREPLASVPAVVERETTPHRQTILVSKEDIYRHAPHSEPVLLLKKGYEVSAEELPRYLKNGARANQFRTKWPDEASPETNPETSPAVERVSLKPGAMHNPLLQPSALRRATRSHKRVLIVEPDQKGLKRIIDCLFICGFSLDKIQPLRVVNHLAWALDKHQPHLLLLDFPTQDIPASLAWLQNLATGPSVTQTIVTLSPHLAMREAEVKWLQRICLEKQIKILAKPVNRFSLNTLLDETE